MFPNHQAKFLANQIEKSDVLPWVRYSYLTHIISPRAHVLSINIGCIGRYLIVERRHKKVIITSVLLKMADVNVGYFKVKLNLFKPWYPKVCKKKNPTWVCE